MDFRYRQELFRLSGRQVYFKLIKIIRGIELFWHDEKKRRQLLEELTAHLSALKDHPESDLHRLGRMSGIDFEKMNLQAFLSVTVPIERKYGLNLTDPDFLISDRDGTSGEMEKIPLTIIVENFRSTYNVGSIFRTAECIGAERIILCGYSATPDSRKTGKTAMGADRFIDWEYVRETEDALEIMHREEIPVIALETVKDAPSVFSFSYPRPCALLLGNERFGLSEDILRKISGVVRIPVYGWKNSLNVGIAFGICGYEIRRQWGA